MIKNYFFVFLLVISSGVIQAQGSDASLSDINLDTGVLTPEFNPEITKYVALIPDGLDNITVGAVPNDVNASFVGGGQVTLANSEMTTITVTAEDGVSKTDYVVFIANENYYNPILNKENLVPNPLMSELTVYGGWGTKSVNTDLSYVYCGKTSIAVNGFCGGSVDFYNIEDVVESGASYLISAMVYVKGSGKAQLGHSLNGTSVNTRTTKTNEWEEVRTIVDITTLNSNPNFWFNGCNSIGVSGDVIYVDNFQMYEVDRDNTLSTISSDLGTLAPEFSSDITEYYLVVDDGTSQVDLSASAASSLASVVGDGVVALTDNKAIANITVTSESGEDKVYTITIDTEMPDMDASLSSLTVSTGTLTPAFDPDVMSYTLAFPEGTKEVTVAATANSSEATVEGDGVIAVVGNGAVAQIIVTSENENQETYTLSWDAVSPHSTSSTWKAYDGGEAPSTSGYMDILFMPVSETTSEGALQLAGDASTASIYYSAEDAAVVRVAAEALADDIERVTGLVPSVSTETPTAQQAVLIGTIGQSSLIDGLIADGKVDVTAIDNKWEAYTAVVVDNPMSGVDKALVIIGNDRRGTAFGVFALSESMGVSPWYFWGDVPVAQKDALYISGNYTQLSHGVKYRGIFLNDEDWGLNPWASKTFEPEVGNIGPKTYATIFELLLRLHANCIWPAMHESPVITTPFYQVPGNKEVADEYAIVISTSHHEPMMTNSHEYDTNVLGDYNYWTNRETIYKFWEDRVKETSSCENIYTIGMRGRDDSGMSAPSGTTDAQKAAKIQDEIIPDQRQMISDHVNKNADEIPQIFIPYKETLVQYQSGLTLPDDVTIMWPDDNHGYIRQLSTASERARPGGSGVYYHLSYWGVPTSYLWFCTTPPGMTCSEMIKAWDFEANKIWLVNVGDLKPMEIGTDFFLRMARNPEGFRDFDQNTYFTQWITRTFGATDAEHVADLLDKYFELNIVKRAEHLSRTSTGFSLVDNGDEAQARLDEFEKLVEEANTIYDALPSEQKPAFYEMVLYQMRATYYVNKRNLQAERSRLWVTQQRAGTNSLAADARAAHASLLAESEFYNKSNADGKWDYMVNPMNTSLLSSWAQETQNPFIEPSYGSYTVPRPSGIGVAIEGSEAVLQTTSPGVLPIFNPAADMAYFIDVFNTGSSTTSWTCSVDSSWVKLSEESGPDDKRIMVSIDWDNAPTGCNLPATITITSSQSEYHVNLIVHNPYDLELSTLPDAVEGNGKVVIEAEDYTLLSDAGEVGWRTVNRATASKDGMTINPITAASRSTSDITSSPSVSYQFYTFSSGPVQINTQCLPTHRITSEHEGVRYAISLNGDAPQVVDIYAVEYSSAWYANTVRAASIGQSSHTIAEPGLQTVKIYMIDAGVVLDKITVNTTGIYEAEDLQVHATNTSVETYYDSPASGGEGAHVKSTSVGHYATFVLPNVKANDYVLQARVKKWGSRGIIKISVAEEANGPYTNIGTTYDLYSSSGVYSDLEPLALNFATDGSKYIRFEVTGKNAAASNYWILLDYISLKPQTLACNEKLPSAIVDQESRLAVNVSPIFSSGEFNVAAQANTTITVYNLSGAKVLEKNMDSSSTNFRLDQIGVYFINLDTSDEHKTFKVVVH